MSGFVRYKRMKILDDFMFLTELKRWIVVPLIELGRAGKKVDIFEKRI